MVPCGGGGAKPVWVHKYRRELSRGQCVVCGGKFALRRDGCVRVHGRHPR